jgi:pilus assembly protein CpaE
MPDGQTARVDIAEPRTAESFARGDRTGAVGFVVDAASEAALRDGLSDALNDAFEVRRGGVRAAIAAQQKAPTPRVLIVDISNEDEPLAALLALSEVVEPETCVLVIGEANDLSLYREITRGLGAGEYLPKPLTRDLVAQHFGPLVRGHSPQQDRVRGGRFVTVTGTQGGVGATAIAANLSWYFATTARRHTMLLDADLHLGNAAFMLNAEASPGLRMAIEAPERIDKLLAERAATPVSERLHVLAGQEKLSQEIGYQAEAASLLLEALRRRYNMIVGDVAWRPTPFCRDLLAAANHRVLVLAPTLASVRDALRMLPGEAGQQRPTLVLNRVGVPGGLKKQHIEDGLQMPVDLVIPDLPRQVGGAVALGEPAVAQKGAFRNAIAELARQVGATTLPDGGAAAAKRGGFRRLLGLGR